LCVFIAIKVLLPTEKKIVFEPTYTYINKGCNFNMNVIHIAPTKKSLSKSFLGLQPSGFRLSQANTFFYWSLSNLQDNNPLIKKNPAKTHWTYEHLFGRQGFVHSAASSKKVLFRCISAKFWFSLTKSLIISHYHQEFCQNTAIKCFYHPIYFFFDDFVYKLMYVSRDIEYERSCFIGR